MKIPNRMVWFVRNSLNLAFRKHVQYCWCLFQTGCLLSASSLVWQQILMMACCLCCFPNRQYCLWQSIRSIRLVVFKCFQLLLKDKLMVPSRCLDIWDHKVLEGMLMGFRTSIRKYHHIWYFCLRYQLIHMQSVRPYKHLLLLRTGHRFLYICLPH